MAKEEIKKTYIVKEKIIESPTIVTLQLTLVDDTIPVYRPGQFITVYFSELGTPEGKAYSISSSPSEKTLAITIRAIGLFSNKLCSMNRGDSFEASLPYGYFFSESDAVPLVLVAGGIGVTPFRSMIVESLRQFPARKIALFQSSRTADDLVFRKEFDELSRKYTNFKTIFFVTRDKSSNPSDFDRRIEVGDLVGNNGDVKAKEFFICGSIPFVRDMWKGLCQRGIPEENICTEAFFSH